MNYDYDLFVIGAGSGGVRAARMSAGFGARVAVAEESSLGGTCVNVGCIPKKLFVYGSHFSEDFEDAEFYGWDLHPTQFDWRRLRDNKTEEVRRLNGIYGELLGDAGVDVYGSRATFVDDHTLRVGQDTITAEHILIATGSRPHVPRLPGSKFVISSNEMFYLPTLPRRIAVVGGGYIAVEFAGIMNGLGVDTTLVYRGPLFLRGFDEGIRSFVKTELEGKGIRLMFNTTVQSIRKEGNTRILLLNDNTELKVDQVLYATGRTPNTYGLELEKAQVETNSNGAVVVDESYQTSANNIYALGDVIDRFQLTPVAIAEGMAFSNSVFGGESGSVDYSSIPTCVFCQPNIGTVGPTEEEATSQFDDLQVFESTFRPLKHTVTKRNERSLMKLLVDGATDRVIAAHMVGSDAGEIIQGLAVAITAKATKADFDRTIAIHPTSAEEFVTMRSRSR
ncbi:MAG: glutathione-disulfide reductase [Gammaproteobacteria bacterium]|nr:glutathione-disulfide reductase [Gammaproteobacteria bacterium]MYD81387.1 glutathione-disulfide reductase [Gammaproteobacteria bacterium]